MYQKAQNVVTKKSLSGLVSALCLGMDDSEERFKTIAVLPWCMLQGTPPLNDL